MTRSILVAIALTTTLVAQNQNSEGPFIGLPVHLLVGDNTLGPAGPLSTDELFLKRAGFADQVMPGTDFGPDRPDFTLDAMFPVRPSGFRLDAISSGYHTIFVEWSPASEPMLRVPWPFWGAFIFSVTKDTVGEPGTVVASEAGASEKAGGDMFSVMLPGSTLPDSIEDCVEIVVPDRANDSSELGLQSGTPPELQDFDPFFTFYETLGTLPSFLVPNPWVYLSVPGSVADTIPSWFGAAGPSGATILKIQWSPPTPPSTVGTWSAPVEHISYLALGLQQDDDIDALSIEENGGLVLLSLKKSLTTTLDHQLMVSYLWAVPAGNPPNSEARPYLYNPTDDGAPVQAVKILGADQEADVDAICEIDPGNTNAGMALIFPYVVGCRDMPSWSTTMSAATSQRPTIDGNTTITVSVSGLQRTVGLSLGAILLWGAPNNNWLPPSSSTTPPAPLDPFVEALGWTYVFATEQSKSVELVYPTSALTGSFLDFQWFMLDQTGIYQSNIASCRF